LTQSSTRHASDRRHLGLQRHQRRVRIELRVGEHERASGRDLVESPGQRSDPRPHHRIGGQRHERGERFDVGAGGDRRQRGHHVDRVADHAPILVAHAGERRREVAELSEPTIEAAHALVHELFGLVTADPGRDAGLAAGGGPLRGLRVEARDDLLRDRGGVGEATGGERVAQRGRPRR
jgi:hypothetical protein